MQMAISLRVMCLFQSVGAVQNNQSLIISRAAMLDNTNVSSEDSYYQEERGKFNDMFDKKGQKKEMRTT
jgi:hypothetical protein